MIKLVLEQAWVSNEVYIHANYFMTIMVYTTSCTIHMSCTNKLLQPLRVLAMGHIERRRRVGLPGCTPLPARQLPATPTLYCRQ